MLIVYKVIRKKSNAFALWKSTYIVGVGYIYGNSLEVNFTRYTKIVEQTSCLDFTTSKVPTEKEKFNKSEHGNFSP